MVAKSWAIKLATEAARTVLSVDQIIVARQAGGPKPPGPNPVSTELQSYCSKKLTTSELGRRLDVLQLEALENVQYQSLYYLYSYCSNVTTQLVISRCR